MGHYYNNFILHEAMKAPGSLTSPQAMTLKDFEEYLLAAEPRSIVHANKDSSAIQDSNV